MVILRKNNPQIVKDDVIDKYLDRIATGLGEASQENILEVSGLIDLSAVLRSRRKEGQIDYEPLD